MFVVSVPKRGGITKPAFTIGPTEEPIFAPAIRAILRHLVGESAPDIAIRGVVFPHGAPLSLGQVGPPSLPITFTRPGIREPLRFGIQGSRRRNG